MSCWTTFPIGTEWELDPLTLRRTGRWRLRQFVQVRRARRMPAPSQRTPEHWR